MDSRLASLMDDLQVQLPGVILGAVQIELRNVLRDFFIETNVWKEDVRVKTKPNVISYDITPTTPGVAVRLMSLTNADDMAVRYATMPEMGMLLLRHEPSQVESWNANVVVTVSNSLDREGNPIFPLWVLDRYYDTVLSGVLAKMMSQSAKPYANTQMAGYYEKRYLTGKAKARHEGNVSNTYGGQRWRYPAFA
jgi:hypothetical protein